MPLRVPVVVRNKAEALGAGDWLRDLPDLVASLEREWSIAVGQAYDDATEGLVARAALADGAPAVLKLVVPRPSDMGPADLGSADVARHEITVLRLAGGEGCARLLRADPERGAILTERLGRSLHELGLPISRRHEILCGAARRRPRRRARRARAR